jgi:hypothetical protein
LKGRKIFVIGETVRLRGVAISLSLSANSSEVGTVFARVHPETVRRPICIVKESDMTSIRDGLGIHANALALREQRNNILASNIANAGLQSPGHGLSSRA